jgi:hypothetical protein
MSWVNAIKEFAKLNGGKYVIPKRDSEDYKKVKEIQERMAKGETIAVPKAKKEKPVKKENVVMVVEEVVTPQPHKKVVKEKPVKKENVEVAPAVLPPDAVKKPRKVVAKPGKKENVVVEEVEVAPAPPVKVKMVKPAKKANVEAPPPEPIADPPKAPKLTAKERRERKEEMKKEALDTKAVARAGRVLMDARVRMQKIDTPVSFDFS